MLYLGSTYEGTRFLTHSFTSFILEDFFFLYCNIFCVLTKKITNFWFHSRICFNHKCIVNIFKKSILISITKEIKVHEHLYTEKIGEDLASLTKS